MKKSLMEKESMDMDLNLLKVFCEIYNTKSLTKAGKILGMSQPTISRKLQGLRELFKDSLFVSKEHQLEPTAKALGIFPEVKQAVEGCYLLFSRSNEPAFKKVIIACSDDFEYFVGPAIVGSFSEKMPEVQVIFHQTNTLGAERKLLQREADFCLTGGGTHSNLVAREGFGFHADVCLYCKEEGRKESKLSLQEYLLRPHISVHYGGGEGVSDEIIRRKEKNRRLVAMTSHYSGLERYILGTKYVALVPLFFARILTQKFPELTYCEMPFKNVLDPVELSYRKDLLRNRFFKDCRQILVDTLSKIDWN